MGDSEAYTVHGDAVAEVNIFEDFFGFDTDKGIISAVLNSPDSSDFFNYSSEHYL
jgi:hypothetical protein